MEYIYSKQSEIESRYRIETAESTQFIFALYSFLGSFFLKNNYNQCHGWSGNLWVDFVFYTSTIWLTYLLVTVVSQIKSFHIRNYSRVVEYLNGAVCLGLWIWLIVLVIKGSYFGCSSPSNLFGVVYLAMGVFAIIGLLINAIVSARGPRGGVSGQYDKNVDFNPYN